MVLDMDSSFASISRRDHPIDDKGGPLLAVAVVFLVLTWVTVSLRFYVRAGISHSTGADDYIMLAALVCFLPSPSHILRLLTEIVAIHHILRSGGSRSSYWNRSTHQSLNNG